MPEKEMVTINLDDLLHLRTLARHGINQTVQHLTVKQLSEATESILKLDTVIEAVESEQVKSVEIEQSLTNIEHKENSHGS